MQPLEGVRVVEAALLVVEARAEVRPDVLVDRARVVYLVLLAFGASKVEAVTGPIDVAHATGLVPCGTSAPLVVTLHDIAFVHDPDKFSKQGIRVMNRSLAAIGRRAEATAAPPRPEARDQRGCAQYRNPRGIEERARRPDAGDSGTGRRFGRPYRLQQHQGQDPGHRLHR